MARKGAILLGVGLAALMLRKKKRKVAPASAGDDARLGSPGKQASALNEPDSPVGEILVFTARWCGVCKGVLPKIQEIAKARPNILFKYIDVDDNPEEAKARDITGVPTFVALQGGEEVDRLIGYRDDESMEKLVLSVIGGEKQIKALPAKVHLPVVDFGPDYMTGRIPESADYRAGKLYSLMPLDTKGFQIVVGPKSCQYCAFVAEPKDGRGAYCTKWKDKVVHNYVCNGFEARDDL
jgi:thioredoxin 1